MVYEQEKILQIISQWREKGYESVNGADDIPCHPEFVFRLSSQWRGWNDFLNIDESDEWYEGYIVRDLIENCAFKQMFH